MSAVAEVFWAFLRLGLTSFGGPSAHLAFFRRAFVEKRRWISEESYADLMAFCQFLPGPGSSQLGFAIGLRRAGLAGGFAAWIGFTAPSAALMIAAAAGLSFFATPAGDALAHGLKLVAVSVVAHAVVAMAGALLRTPAQWALAGAALAALMLAPSPWLAPALIVAAGALAALPAKDRSSMPFPARPRVHGAGDRGAGDGGAGDLYPGSALPLRPGQAALGLFAVLAVFPVVVLLDPRLADLAWVMAKAGGLVFGGGHVVLPLIEAEVAARGWLSAPELLAGYGAAQALPGPLFSFAAFVGAAHLGWQGGLVALAAIFAPGLALVLIGLPLWERVKRAPRAQGFVAGASAAVVGVLAAAFVDPVFSGGVRGPWDFAIAALGFAALQWLKAPTLAVVLAVAAAGAAISAYG